MKKFAQNLAALVKVKTIVTLVVLAVFCVLALRGDITPENVMQITTTVVVFYFGTQHEKKDTDTAPTDHTCPFMPEDETTEGIEIINEDGGDLNV